MHFDTKDISPPAAHHHHNSALRFRRGEEALGKKCYEVFPGTQCHTLLCPATNIMQGSERLEYETVKKRRDGSDIHCILTATPFLDPAGELIGIVEDFKDITERKCAENEINALKQQIEFILGATQGAYVRISIEDRGIVIPPSNLSKIFDPYFTTKQKGSGLGLTTAYYIIRKHGGYIQLDSSPGRGTACRIFLPVSRYPLPIQSKDKIPVLPGKGKILVMDDEEILRDFTSRILRKSGYDVVLASDGLEAIERYREAKLAEYPFDAVIMDLTVPGGMGGKEAIRELLKIDPDIKAIVSSGYSEDPIMSNYREYGFKVVVAKPYTLEELTFAISTLMGKSLAKH